MDPHINPESGVWDDNYYANIGSKLASGGSSSGSYSSASDYISAITGALKPPPKPYSEVNPFSFDEALARQAATAEYAPYYQEQLADYTSKMNRTISRSDEDLKSTQEFLSGSKDYYVGNEKKILDRAIRSANEGYAGRGLFFSGARGREIKELNLDTESNIGEYMRGYQYKIGQEQLGNTRTKEDVNTDLSMYTRDIGRQQKAAIEGGVLTRKNEAREEYEAARNKYYEAYNYGG